VVVVQTMKEYGWREDSFWSLAPDCLLVLGAEILVDWIKHAFITRFNEVPADVYKDYTISLAYDLAQTKQKYAFSDHSDIVSRRMGFIPLPLGVVMLRVVYSSVKSTNPGAWAVVVMAYFCLLTFRILGSIVILGKACDLIDEHKNKQDSEKKDSNTPNTKSTSKDDGNAPATSTPSSRSPPSSPPPSCGQDPALFQLPTEGQQKRFLFQNSCVEGSDVLLTNMNSVLGQVVEDLQETEHSSVSKVKENLNLVTCEVVEAHTEGVDIKDIVQAENEAHNRVSNNSVVIHSRLHNCDMERGDEDGLELMHGGSRIRSLSSPDLVTEACQGPDEWDGALEDGLRRRGDGGGE